MCESTILARTGLDVAQHQELTISNYLELRSFDAELPFMPVLQGQSIDDYHRCADRYEQRGVDLATAPWWVSAVSADASTPPKSSRYCARSHSGYRLHAFGAKYLGLARYADIIASSNSLAWSFAARWQPPLSECHGHRRCNNCVTFALRWRRKVLDTTEAAESKTVTAASLGGVEL
ncbi:hypothetical protein AB0J55_28350 [Amycolatopsis sp. NPDC049688]|uniref:deazapurine DNA modification protein DpdA family protein n=1 Tax=Amycolatopsis sp. NPDC049688 TaxID=3154733 RepID=UPI00342ADC52